MRKAILVCLTILIIPLFGISYLHINGSDYAEVEMPATINLTADMNFPGDLLTFRIYRDINNNGELDSEDPILTYFGIIDGVPTLGDVETNFIDGDDDGAIDGDIYFEVDMDMMNFESMDDEITLFAIAEDIDGSTESATLVLTIGGIPVGEPPYFVGTISDSESGLGIEGLIISLTDEDGEDEYMSFTDEDGHYCVSVPGSGTYNLTALVDMSGIYPSLVDVEFPMIMPAGIDSIVLDTVFTAFTARINGRVVFDADDEGVPGVMLYSFNVTTSEFSAAQTDEYGYYSLGQNWGPTTMAYVSISDDNPRYVADTSFYMVMVTSESVDVEDFRLIELNTYIDGYLFDSDSITPVAGVNIAASSMMNFYNTMTLENGYYRIYVAPFEEYTINIESSDLSTLPDHITVEIDSSSSTDNNFYIDDELGLPYVSGNVVNGAGDPIADAYVILSPESDIIDWRYMLTDETGAFEFREFLPGEWKLGAYKDGYSEATPELEVFDLLMAGYYDDAEFVMNAEGIEDKNSLKIENLELIGAYPNPFNPSTSISVRSNNENDLTLEVFDKTGHKVRELKKVLHNAGVSEFKLEGDDLPSGTYLYKVSDDESEISGKIILIK